jgi:hypothetical protein
MKSQTQLFISVSSAIVVFDVAGSFASRLLHFDYASLMWVTFCLYMAAVIWVFNIARYWADSFPA